MRGQLWISDPRTAGKIFFHPKTEKTIALKCHICFYKEWIVYKENTAIVNSFMAFMLLRKTFNTMKAPNSACSFKTTQPNYLR
jgi:hypothetical protein